MPSCVSALMGASESADNAAARNVNLAWRAQRHGPRTCAHELAHDTQHAAEELWIYGIAEAGEQIPEAHFA